MADNLGYTPGQGAEIATDEVAGRHYQLVKLAHGPDGTASDVSSQSPLPIDGTNIALFREAFESYTPGVRWSQTVGSGDIVMLDGNAASASYLVISKSPLQQGTETAIESLLDFTMPVEIAYGAHMSQRTLGQEFSVEFVDTGTQLPDVADLAITEIRQSTTTLTITTATNHGLSVGKSIGVRGVIDTRVNFPALVIASVPAPNQLTATAGPGGTIASQSAYVSSVLAATTAALPAATYANGTAGVGATLTATANGAFPDQDGVAIPLGGRVLVKNQTAGLENGIYTLTQVGSGSTPWILTRAVDFDTTAEMTVVAGVLFGVTVFVTGGTTQALREFYLSATVTTVGTTAVTFVDSGTAGPLGFVYSRERLGRANNGAAQIFENATATNASLYVRSEAGDALPSGTVAGNHSATVGSTASVQLAGAVPYTYSFSATNEYRLVVQSDRTQWSDAAVDSVAAATSRLVRTQVCPDPTDTYKLRLRATNNKSLTVPNAQVVSVTKSGSTTATFTTDVAHGLTSGDLAVYYGSSDTAAANFPNLATATAITVTGATTFTAVIGTGTTGTAYGGFVARVQGGNLMSSLGVTAQTAINATLTTRSDGTRQLVLTGNGNWAGVAIGDLVNAIGVRSVPGLGSSLGVEGAWRVANIATTALTLVSLPGQTWPANFAQTNCGGSIIRRTDLRLSYVRVFDFKRNRVEMLPRPAGDIGASVPVAVTNTPAMTVSSGTVTTVSAVTSANLGIPGIIADVASAALTTTTTTAAVTPTFGTAYSVSIPVTAVSGTPTLDVSIEESDDSGTNWFKVYDFPRITTTGIYRSPLIRMVGNRVRYVQTVGGGSPSVTRAINRLQSSSNSEAVRQLIDRSVVLTTLNSTTPSLDTRDAGNRLQLVLNVGAITTTAPALQLEGSDDNGASWYAIGTPLTAVASSTVQLTVTNVNSALVRARVSTAGSGVTAGYVMVKAHD
jgi:hypothetical protein